MRVFANSFLVAFALEGLVAIALSQFEGPGTTWHGGARSALSALLTLASLPLFVLMGIHPGLRWRIFLPPCLFLSWIAMGAMPLPLWLNPSDAGLVAGGLEVAFAGLAFALCRRANGGDGWLLRESALRGLRFSGRTALSFTAVNFLLILPASLAYLAYSLAAGVAHVTQGFVEIRSDGIHLAHREYVRDQQTIHLVAMMHVGDPAFYRDLVETLPTQGAITLAEGVSDRDALLSKKLSYGGLAAGLGLVEQPAFGGGQGEVRHADVDLSDFSPDTREFLADAGKLFAAQTLEEAIIAYAELSDMSSETAARMMTALKHDLIDLRNEHLAAEIANSLSDHDVIVVPWGALHLPGIQQSVLALGFAQVAVTDRRVVSW